MSEQAAAARGEGRGPNPSTEAGRIADSNTSPPPEPLPLPSSLDTVRTYVCGNKHVISHETFYCDECYRTWLAATFPVFPVA